MLNLAAQFEHRYDPFVIHVAQNLLDRSRLIRLYNHMPAHSRRIVRSEAYHEKQYAMNLLYLVQDGARNATVELSEDWDELVSELRGDAFLSWLEAGTGLRLRDLSTDIGMYTHNDGDFISVHKDKANKALTAILYLNETWSEDAGGGYEVRASDRPDDEPVRILPPAVAN